MRHFYMLLFGAGLLFLASASCKKYLDAKPDITLVTPTTVESLQEILDNYEIISTQCSEATEIAADNYYLDDATYNALPAERHRNAYIWGPRIFLGGANNDWVLEYNVVYNADVVLDNINSIGRSQDNSASWDNLEGCALFFRGKSFYEIAQVWTKAYDSTTAGTDPGIPLRLTSDFNEASTRASIQDSYNRIIADLQAAIPLLPVTPVHPYRPSKAAAYGYLARTYLAMRNYKLSGLYADSCLQLKDALLDYNLVDSTPTYPFTSIQFSNPEDVYHSSCNETNYDLVRGLADTTLYSSYDPNDLRKRLYFAKKPSGSFYFQGSYDGFTTYNGIATDEMYLVRAECEARAGKTPEAMSDLNTVLVRRWKTGTFTPFAAASASDALEIILTERRKELVFRMCRFTDIKRLNKEGAGITVTRVIGGITYTLNANDPRDALPIPEAVIQFTGMAQN